MRERLSYYIQRNSLIHRLNPLTKIVLALSIVLVTFLSPWYWTAHMLLLLIVVPLAFASRVSKEFFSTALRLILPASGFIFIMQALFQPGGNIVIFKFLFLDVTDESLAFAFRVATRIAVMISAFTLLLMTTHPSELMSDLTRRGLPGQFAYVIISTLQILPQMQAKAQTIISAQRARGLDTESTFLKRAGSLLPLVGPLVFGSLVEVEERAIAIEARGFTSTHIKTSLHDISDTSFDSFLRWILIALVIITVALKIWLS
ncbi:MAG: energy-coupling factor transporter transmembrane component T [Chloroflexota bacterium]